MRYFLASNSPRRRELLRFLLDEFEVDSESIEEKLSEDREIEAQLMSLAFQKAFALEQKLRRETRVDTGDLIIGADTIVYLDGILGKPRDKRHAVEMLKKLSGRVHTVYTSIAIIKSGCNKNMVDLSETRVFFRELQDKEIRDYVDSGEPLDKAGSYGIQGKGAKFIERIEGDFYSVMGLPINKLDGLLKKMDETDPYKRSNIFE